MLKKNEVIPSSGINISSVTLTNKEDEPMKALKNRWVIGSVVVVVLVVVAVVGYKHAKRAAPVVVPVTTVVTDTEAAAPVAK